jgi:hypothetical protein
MKLGEIPSAVQSEAKVPDLTQVVPLSDVSDGGIIAGT